MLSAPAASFIDQPTQPPTRSANTLHLASLGLSATELSHVLRALPSTEFTILDTTNIDLTAAHTEMICAALSSGKLEHLFMKDVKMLQGAKSASLLAAAFRGTQLASVDMGGIIWPDAASRGRMLQALASCKSLKHVGMLLVDDLKQDQHLLEVTPRAAAAATSAQSSRRGPLGAKAAAAPRNRGRNKKHNKEIESESSGDSMLQGSVQHLCELICGGGFASLRSLSLRGSRLGGPPCCRLLGQQKEPQIIKFLAQLLHLDLSNCVLPPLALSGLQRALQWPSRSIKPSMPEGKQQLEEHMGQTQHASVVALPGVGFPCLLARAADEQGAPREQTQGAAAEQGQQDAHTPEAAAWTQQLLPLPRLSTLLCLDLHSCSLSGQFDSLQPLASAMGAHPRLQCCRLDRNDLTVQGATSIMHAMENAIHSKIEASTAASAALELANYPAPAQRQHVLWLDPSCWSEAHHNKSSKIANFVVRSSISPSVPDLVSLPGSIAMPPSTPTAKRTTKRTTAIEARNTQQLQRRAGQSKRSNKIAQAPALKPLVWNLPSPSDVLDWAPRGGDPADDRSTSQDLSSLAGTQSPAKLTTSPEEAHGSHVVWSMVCLQPSARQLLSSESWQWEIAATWLSLQGTRHTTSLAHVPVTSFASTREGALHGEHASVGEEGGPQQVWYCCRLHVPTHLLCLPSISLHVDLLKDKRDVQTPTGIAASRLSLAGSSALESSALLL